MAMELKESSHSSQTTELMTMVQAINDGLRTMLEEDERTILLG